LHLLDHQLRGYQFPEFGFDIMLECDRRFDTGCAIAAHSDQHAVTIDVNEFETAGILF
jgi:hypothetical protein